MKMTSSGFDEQLKKEKNSWLSRCCTTRGPVFRYYRMVPPRWGLVSSVFFTVVPRPYKIKNTWLILLSHFILHPFASMLYPGAKCHNQLFFRITYFSLIGFPEMDNKCSHNKIFLHLNKSILHLQVLY